MELVRGISSFSAVVLGIYSAMIFVRIIVSWILFFLGRRRWSSTGESRANNQGQGFSGVLSSLDSFLGKICDPYLNLFSGVKSLRRSNLNLTPLLALVVLNLVRTLLGTFAEIGTFTGGLVLAVLLEVVWRNLGSFLLFILIVLLVIRVFLGRSVSPEANNWINNIDPILDSPVSFVYKLFFRGKKADDQKVVIASIFFYVFVLIGLGLAVDVLVDLLKSV